LEGSKWAPKKFDISTNLGLPLAGLPDLQLEIIEIVEVVRSPFDDLDRGVEGFDPSGIGIHNGSAPLARDEGNQQSCISDPNPAVLGLHPRKDRKAYSCGN
jgi:hypothetical protein